MIPRYKIRKLGQKRRTEIRCILRMRKITITKLAEMSGLLPHQVSDICSGKQKDMLLSTAKKICNALDISLDEAFSD